MKVTECFEKYVISKKNSSSFLTYYLHPMKNCIKTYNYNLYIRQLEYKTCTMKVGNLLKYNTSVFYFFKDLYKCDLIRPKQHAILSL